MFEGKSLHDILEMGGPVFLVLICLSITSLTVICYKIFEFWKKGKISRAVFMPNLFEKIKNGGLDKAIEYCDKVNAPIAAVAKSGIVAFKTGESLGEFMDREIMLRTVELERYVIILGTVGNIAIYIGLLGTVIGIIGAFGNMSEGGGGISGLIGHISEALLCTATGLVVAIPASTAYNFITKKIDKFVIGMEYCASAIEDKFNLNK
ncbi:MAG: MotA/TolQ/ExbB proton channel family protein [Endomicrobium sp.]|jgi:biopolymer transport protein ExbB|nr:MotA/TolQ/ExbB proton channel family protein [Endomicrobium sp.]